MIRYAKLNVPLDITALQQEVRALSHSWSPHFNTMHYEGEWTVLPLRVPGGDSNKIVPDLMGGDEYMDTPLMDSFPSVKALLNEMQCPILSVRFLNLRAGANIKPHRDHELAFEKGEARLHFPVFTHEQVEFYVEDDLLRMHEGECWYINANLMHRVANKGTTDRIHLVIDCSVNQWLSNQFSNGDKNEVAEEVNRTELLKVIAELRLQQNEAANKLAAELEQTL